MRKLYHERKTSFVIYSSIAVDLVIYSKPQLLRVLKESKAKLGVEIDIENDQDIARQAEVSGTPTVHLFKNKELKNNGKGLRQEVNINPH